MSDYNGTIENIDEQLADQMRGRSWRDDPRCPPFAELVLLRLPHTDFDGHRREGEMVVARSVADAVMEVFARIDASGYPIARMDRIDVFDGDDERSMAANNSSAFNFRLIAGTDELSNHARGLAIDINPEQNPWVRGDRVQPLAGAAYLDRSVSHPAIIRRPGPVVEAFESIGWEWGGDWDGVRDYHHFSAVPRRRG